MSMDEGRSPYGGSGSEPTRHGPRGVYVVWAIVSLIGFALLDFRPEWSAWLWPVAGLLGGVASWLLGYSAARRRGEPFSQGWQHALLWTGATVALLMVTLAHRRGMLDQSAMAPVILLLLGFAFYTAGVFLIPRLLWIGLVVAACYVVQVALRGFSWSVTGGVVALGLLIAAFVGPRDHEDERV
jgi:hypothetical protein